MAENGDVPYIVIEQRRGSVSSMLFGAIVGAGAALLLAPRSGRETRQELGDGARRLRDTAEDSMKQVQNTVAGGMETLRAQVDEQMDAARDAMEAGREAARETRREMERRVRDMGAPRQEPGEPSAGAAEDEEASED